MALNSSTLQASLLDLFTNLPTGDNAVEDAADRWSSAIGDYAEVVLPDVNPAVAAAAQIVFKTTLISLFLNNSSPTFLTSFSQAFATYATSLASGMAPSYVAVPPPVLINFSISNQDTAEQAAVVWANIIHTWFLTGTATPSGGGPVINWS